MSHPESHLRRQRVIDALGEQKLDGFIVSALPNIRYLSGFTGSNALLLISFRGAVLFTDPRYATQAAEQADCEVRVPKNQLAQAAAGSIRRRRLKRIGFESARVPHADYERMKITLPAGARLVPVSGLVEKLRVVKDSSEIGLIRDSVRTCSKAYERVLKRIRPGMKELEIAAELDYQMRRLGADSSAFDTIVASGPRTALPHAEPSEKTINNNELLLIDMGARQRGYMSDMTRVTCLGKPSRRTRKLYQAVLEAQLAALDEVKENATADKIDRRARTVLAAHGLAGYFVHSTGHGLGLEIHESPRIGTGNHTRLQAGMVITIEPGVYMEGSGGVRIEDTVVVNTNGCEILTPTSKDLLVI